MRHFKSLGVLSLLLLGGCVVGDATENPNRIAASNVHSQFIMSDKGFGLDPNRLKFHDSFETDLAKWTAVQPGTSQGGDTWKVADTQSYFGTKSLTYGSNGAITKAVELGEATLATKDAISLLTLAKPKLILFARLDQTGADTDQTALRVDVSQDLGFTWDALKPEQATDSTLVPPNKTWTRYRYDLSAYASQSIRVRLTLKATLNDRKLPYVDDLLVVDQVK